LFVFSEPIEQEEYDDVAVLKQVHTNISGFYEVYVKKILFIQP